MYLTYFLLLWTFWIVPVKSQVHLNPFHYYKPKPKNGFPSSSNIKTFKSYSGPLLISYEDTPREVIWAKNPGTQHQNKIPQGQFVLYYTPLKPNPQNPHTNSLRNIKIINHGLNSNHNFDHETKSYNKLPKEANYDTNLSPENSVPLREEVEIEENRDDSYKNHKHNFYPPVPKSFMEPPGFETSDYRHYEKAGEMFENEKKKKKDYNNENYKNHKMYGEEEDFDVRTPYVRDHAPENETQDLEESSEVESEESKKEDKNSKQIFNVSEISPDGDRVEFQIQGHNGPKTYVFGFDTGDGKNRQYRLEERLKDGTVKGQYGYYDARGKLRAIKYIARPMEGYEEKHHESFVPSSSSN